MYLYILSFAADLVMFADTKVELQRLINRLKEQCDRFLLKINIAKPNESRHEKTCLREVPTGPDLNRPAQLQKLALGLKLCLQKQETLHYLGSEQQMC